MAASKDNLHPPAENFDQGSRKNLVFGPDGEIAIGLLE
jgi:hypothetical protein